MKNDTAIDFKTMLLQEKRKARQKRQKPQEIVCTKAADSAVLTNRDEEQQTFDWTMNTSPPSVDVDLHRISKQNIDGILYVPRFLCPIFTSELLKWLQGLPNSNGGSSERCHGRWNTMKFAKRRVALFDESVETLPKPLQLIAEILVSAKVFEPKHKPNHVLINEYEPSHGILPHTDGPVYFDRTATISIGGGNVLLQFAPRLETNQVGKMKSKSSDEACQVFLEGNGSLVVFYKDAYTNYCHGIDDKILVEYSGENCLNVPAGTEVQRGYRVSLTFRHKFE